MEWWDDKIEGQVNQSYTLTLQAASKAPVIANRYWSKLSYAQAYVDDMESSAVPGLILSVYGDTDDNNGIWWVKKVATQKGEKGELIRPFATGGGGIASISFELGSDQNDAVSLDINGEKKSISVDALRTSLGLKSFTYEGIDADDLEGVLSAGDGIAYDEGTISLAPVYSLTPGDYIGVTVDKYGRVTKGKSKIGIDDVTGLSDKFGDYVLLTDYDEEIGKINKKFGDYVLRTDYDKDINDSETGLAARIAKIEGWFELDDNNNIRTTYNFYSTKQLASGGIGDASGSGLGLILNEWPTDSEDYSKYALGGNLGIELNTRLTAVEGKATNVTVSPTLSQGKPMGTIMVDGVSQTMYAPASYSADDIVPTQERNFVSLQDIEYWNTAYLPLTGGTLSGTEEYILEIKRTNGTSAYIKFTTVRGNNGYLGFGSDGKPTYLTYDGAANELYHKGNLDISNYLPLSGGTLSARLTIAAGSDKKIVLNNTDNDNKYQFISFQQNGTEYGRLGTAGSDDLMWGKEGYEKTILHSGNIGSYNAGSATKLETARTIWGQSFDGTGDVKGPIYGRNKVFAIYGFDGTNNYNILDADTNNSNLWLGYGSAPKSYNTNICGNVIYLKYGTGRANGLILNSSGNVTIGSSDLAGTDYKLAVGGEIRVIRSDGAGTNVTVQNSNGSVSLNTTTNRGVYDNTTSKWLLGYYPALSLTAIGGYSVFCVKDSGNVGIGTTDPQYKLDVNGNGRYKGNLHLCTSSGAGSYGKYLGFGYHGTRIVSDNSNFAESFRTTMFGNSSAGTRFITFRTDTTVDGLCEIYGNGIAWASGDTHGYLAVSYGSYKAYIGGGSSDKLSWYAQLFHSQMSIIPATDKTHNIGSATYRYANAYLSNSVRIGNAILSWDSTNNALKIEGNVYSTGQMASGGIGEEGDNIATYDKWGGLKPAYSTTGKATLTTASASFTNNPKISARTTTEGRYYAVEMDSVGRAFVNVPWTDTNYWTLDASVSRIYPKDAARQLCVGGAGNSAYSTSLYKLVVHGSAFAISGTWQSSSDMTMKDVVKDITLDIKDIANAPSFAFTWKGSEDKTEWLGTSAQYWKAILPTAVKGDDGSYSLSYGELALTTAIAIAKKTMNHEERIKELERQITTLKRKLSVYEN